jgi:hypothetical protein
MKNFFNSDQHAIKFSFGFVVCLGLILVGCGRGAPAPPVILSSIAISPDPVYIGTGTKLSLKATGIYSNATTVDLTSQATWISADQLIASVDSTGVISAVATTGATTTITAAYNGVTSPAVTVTVTSSSSSSSNELITGRYDHTATRLLDGKVLVAGGYDATGALYSSELYDPGTGMWIATGSLNTKRGDQTAVLLDSGLVLVMGGVDGINSSSHDPVTAELYDPGTGMWTLTSSLITPRSYHSVTLLLAAAPPSTARRVMVVGGGNQTTRFLNSAEIYDPATATPTGTWTATTGPLAIARDSLTATLLNDGRVLVVGGNSDVGVLASAELYNPVTDRWSGTGSLAKGRSSHTATLLTTGPDAGKVLVVGGSDSAGKDIASAEIYDPGSGTWSPTGSLGIARYNHTATLMQNGQVMVIGGSNASTTSLSSVELYDPNTGTWSGAANLQTGRVVHTATLLTVGPHAGSVLVVGGDGAAGTLSSVELHN